MTHIANCMRATGELNSVYIAMESSASPSPTQTAASEDTLQPLPTLEKTPSLLNLQTHFSASTGKYQLWPSSQQSRSPVGLSRPNLSSDKLSALSMGRSPTSLSDTAVSSETVPFWQRSGSLARRRKVSVPELGSTMTTVQEAAIDSPTIPGRPPIRQAASTENFGHERSSSAPGTNWRSGPFGDALISCVTGPSAAEKAPLTFLDSFTGNKLEPSSNYGKPLSPILSPGVNPKPSLKVDTTTATSEQSSDIPPEVPPKSPTPVERKGSPSPLKLNNKSSRSQLMTPSTLNSSGNTPTSALDARRSPNVGFPLPTPLSAISNPFSAGSPSGAFDRRGSPRTERRDPFVLERTQHARNVSESSVASTKNAADRSASHNRNISEASVMDRGRPVRRSNSKKPRSRTNSEAQDPNAPAADGWKLPQGMRASEASMRMRDTEKATLRQQAMDQAEKFEVLNKRDVASTSRELRALDERCDYLRKTYKSLRAGRQKLHGRMISYLKRGETVIFSRESLLKQEEALAELDVSIDEFIQKLEQAENRRLRLRQKLLEHVAAALVLNPTAPPDLAESTPPRSPVKADSPSRADRKEVESIKIYADGQVLNLFSDIEQAIGRMCEQTA
ncbi:unnamed protein product [Periconia digitata]|uniref:Up-regulated during septation protein 1 domain-containing protein n=1 Tax=Periconia digitata TaxID=1303443 RepID=A0A9W4UPQ3_9PLEO|nr:unnamed protein product [Periconia digitata]